MRSVNKVDYAGFTFAGIHSSQFGLYSVSSGDRYSRYLSPTIKNLTAENTGGNGTYFFGSQYTQQTFSFSMAFDSVTESELREIKQWLSSGVNYLILDETPYIEYYVKVSAATQINFLVFDDYALDDSSTIDDLYGPSTPSEFIQRLYKGEMSISFIAYEPFGYSVNKWLDNYSETSEDIKLKVSNKKEWAAASGLLANNLKDGTAYYDVWNGSTGVMGLYNGGDRECDYVLNIEIGNAAHDIEIKIDEDSSKRFKLSIPAGSTTDARDLIVDTKKRLVTLNGIVANNNLTEGDFFKIPLGESTLRLTTGLNNVTIDYKYCYI